MAMYLFVFVFLFALGLRKAPIFFILSGIVGYVLGQLSGRPRGRVEGESHS